MILTTEQIKQTVADYFKNKPVEKVYLFGSYARGEANEKSDVDLLVDLGQAAEVTYFTLGGYSADMEDSFLRRVDLVLEESVFPQLKPKIEQEKILLFQA